MSDNECEYEDGGAMETGDDEEYHYEVQEDEEYDQEYKEVMPTFPAHVYSRAFVICIYLSALVSMLI